MMSENAVSMADKFDKLSEGIEKFSRTFDTLTEKIESVHQIPLVDVAVDMTEKMNSTMGAVLKTIITGIDAFTAWQQKMIDLRRTSIETGAAFGLTAKEIKKYSNSQLSLQGELQSSLFNDKQTFDSYQKFMRNSAFGLKDLEQPIRVQEKTASSLKAAMAIATITGVELNDTLKELEAGATKMGGASKTQTAALEEAVRAQTNIIEMSAKLGNVSAPYIKQQIFQAISGQEASITNYGTKMNSLTKAFEAFWVGLGPGEKGLAGEFLQKLNKGFMDMSIGMAAWMAGPDTGVGMGDAAAGLDFLMDVRSGQGQGEIIPAITKMNNTLGKSFQNQRVDSWENLHGVERNAAAHAAQRGMIMKQFGVKDNEAEKLMHLFAIIKDPLSGANQLKEAQGKVTDILAGAADVNKMQLTYLQRANTYLKGIYMKTFYGDRKEMKDLEKAIGTQDEFQKTMADKAVEAEKARYDKDPKLKGKWSAEVEEKVRSEASDKAAQRYGSLQDTAITGGFAGKGAEEMRTAAFALEDQGGGDTGDGQAVGGKQAVNVDTSSPGGKKMAEIVQENEGRGYNLGGKGEGRGAIDCSGFTKLFYEKLYKSIYKDDPTKLKEFSKGLDGSSAQVRGGQRLGWLGASDTNRSLPSGVGAGDLIGLAFPGADVSHVAVIVPGESGGLQVWDSAGGKSKTRGVQHYSVGQYLSQYAKKMNMVFVRPQGMATAEARKSLEGDKDNVGAKDAEASSAETEPAKGDWASRAKDLIAPANEWAKNTFYAGKAMAEEVSGINKMKKFLGLSYQSHFNGLLNATENQRGKMDPGELIASSGIASKIRARGGVMSAVSQPVVQTPVKSQPLSGQGLDILSSPMFVAAVRGVVGNLQPQSIMPQLPTSMHLRPSELPIRKEPPTDNIAIDSLRSEKSKEQKLPPLPPNVTNRISIGNVMARVDRIVIPQTSISHESNDRIF